jgi:hypothetical protein
MEYPFLSPKGLQQCIIEFDNDDECRCMIIMMMNADA